jgi:hypothetical protein
VNLKPIQAVQTLVSTALVPSAGKTSSSNPHCLTCCRGVILMKTLSFGPWVRGLGLFTFLLCLVGLVGCGSGKATVKGKVTLDGQAITQGKVYINVPSQNNETVSGDINSDGTYTVEKVPTGEAFITIQSPKPIKPQNLGASMTQGRGGKAQGPTQTEAMKDQQQKAEKDYEEKSKTWKAIPMDYSNQQKKKFVFTIEKGTNDINLPMTSK